MYRYLKYLPIILKLNPLFSDIGIAKININKFIICLSNKIVMPIIVIVLIKYI